MWFKIDDGLREHPRVLAAPEAFGLYVAGLCYCNHQLTDGRIPESAIPRLLPLPKIGKLRARLVEVGLWVEIEGGIEVHAYLKHNRSAAEIAELQAKRAAAGAKGGSKSASKHQANASALAQANEGGVLNQIQIDTEKKREEPKKLTSLPAEDDLDFEAFWADYPSQNWPATPNPKPGKVNAKAQWKRLSPTEQAHAASSLQHYKAYLELSGQQTKHCERYLQQKAFNAYQQPPTPAPGPSGNDPPKGKNARAFEAVIQRMGVSNEPGTSTASHEVPQRSLPAGRVEPGALHALG
jgi:hypothetical protein